MERYADISRHLRPQDQLIGDIDTLIPATALEREVTTDEGYQRVLGLQIMPFDRPTLAVRAG